MATRLNAIHGVNKYLWDKGLNPRNPMFYENTAEIPDASQSAVWAESYDGRNIFVPVDRISQFNSMKFTADYPPFKAGDPKPYIVFTSVTPQNRTDWFVESEQAIYLIYSTNLENIRTIINFIHDEMKKMDQSAQNVNTYIDNVGSDKFSLFDYKSISVANINGAAPADEAGGRMEAMITLDIMYTQKNSGVM